MGDTTEESVPDKGPLIYLTGFEPFPPHTVNSSQKAVEHLDCLKLGKELGGVRIEKEIIKVEYDYISRHMKKRWKELSPKLTVHVGVSGQAENLVVEQLAHNKGYEKNDNKGCLPEGKACCCDGEDVIQSCIGMDLVSKAVNNNTDFKLTCIKSTDAGRFACDFIYYTSLNIDRPNRRVAFIHVPTLNKFSEEEIASAIAVAIKEMYRQVCELYDNDHRKEV